MSKTTHSWPPLMRRRTMLAPILPRPIIPSCIVVFLSSWLGRSFDRGTQAFQAGRHPFAVTENRRTRHQDIGASRDAERSCRRVDPAVQLQFTAWIDSLDHFAHASDLRQCRLEKMLMAETRVHGH